MLLFLLKSSRCRASILFSLCALANGAVGTAADEPVVDAEHRVTVFEAKTDGYPVYRIPALVRAANGELLAFCEARQGNDASEIDLVLKRSSDAGRTWGELERVQTGTPFRDWFGENPPPITVGNPAPVVDHLDPEHPGRIWLPFTVENSRVCVVYSDDHGVSWSSPREITAEVKLDPWGWYATGPVHSIQLTQQPHRGRLVVPCDHRLGDDGADRGANGAHAIYSDDHGQTWQLGAIDATYDDGLNANETSVIELADGTLYFNTRDQGGDASGTRGEAFSSDGGETFLPRRNETAEATESSWQTFRPSSPVLDAPVVQCSLLNRTTAAGKSPLLLFCGPDENGPTGPGRSDLRIRYSRDEAESWSDGPLIHVGPAAYSDMAQVGADHLGILFEAGSPDGKNPYQRIEFVLLEWQAIDRN